MIRIRIILRSRIRIRIRMKSRIRIKFNNGIRIRVRIKVTIHRSCVAQNGAMKIRRCSHCSHGDSKCRRGRSRLRGLGRRGSNFLVQMIFTCLRYTKRKGEGAGTLWVMGTHCVDQEQDRFGIEVKCLSLDTLTRCPFLLCLERLHISQVQLGVC
jgi:hypothetical protein